MKTRFTIFSLVIAFAMTMSAFSQTNYYISSSVGANADYNYLTNGNVVMEGNGPGLADALSAAQTIPFYFSFYGNLYDSYKISDNGYITFDAGAKTSSAANSVLPSVTAPKNAIFAFWDALVLTKPDTQDYTIKNWTYGTAPNRIHVIQWSQIHRVNFETSTYTFAIRLYEHGTFDVVYNYYSAGAMESVTTATLGCQNEDGSLGFALAGSPNIEFPKDLTSGTNETFLVYSFIFGEQHSYDMSGVLLDIPPYAKTGTEITIKGKLKNLGSETINSFTLNYSVDGGAPVSATISDLNILSDADYIFTHPTTWTIPSQEKDYEVSVWASMINGNDDENTANDRITASISGIENLINKKPLFEVFTSSTCGPCKPGNESLTAVLDQYPEKWTVVKYQYYFPGTGDPYYTTEGRTRGTFYGDVNSVPRLEVDGGFDDHPSNLTNVLFEQFQATPSYVSITGDASLNETTHTVNVTGNIKSYSNYTGSINAFIAIVEKKTTQNVKSNGETEFHFVMKKMLPDANGIALGNVEKGVDIPINQSYTFPGAYRLPSSSQDPINVATEHSVEEFSDLAAVIWLQNMTTKEIYQSEVTDVATSIDENSDNFKVNLYPNPLTTNGKIQFNLANPTLVSFDIINSIGQKVYSSNAQFYGAGTQTLEFDANTLLSGAYYMNLYLGDKVITRTFVK